MLGGHGVQMSAHDALSRLIDRAVTVRDLVDDTLLVVQADASVSAVLAIMDARDFDVVGVDFRGPGSADHYARKRDLGTAERLSGCATPRVPFWRLTSWRSPCLSEHCSSG